MQIWPFAYVNFIQNGNDLVLIRNQICFSKMNSNYDMVNLPYTFTGEMSAILLFGGHLENGQLKWPGILFECM